MGKIKKIRLWGRYHRIELFGSMVGLICLGLIINCISIGVYAKNIDKDVLTNQAIYASEFITSLSGVQGNIAEVYTNKDHTKCGILIHFDDMTNIVTDAMEYQLYVKGFNVSKGTYAAVTKSKPTGGFYMFGSTGYGLIYLVDNAGFAEQALEIVVRCNEHIYTSTDTSEMSELKQKDGSYEDNDQFRIIINPSAKLATVVDFLDDFDVVSLYQDAVVNASEDTIREKLTKDVAELNTKMKAIQNYKKALSDLNVKVPDMPDTIVGDSFSNLEDGTLVYTPGHVLAGGVDIDWYTHTLKDSSFLTEDLIGLKTPMQFFGDLAAAEPEEMPAFDTFYMLDGTEIVEDGKSGLADMQAIAQNIDNYRKAVQEYFQLKTQYQTQDLVSYLELEYNMQNTGKHFTSNYSENTVILW